MAVAPAALSRAIPMRVEDLTGGRDMGDGESIIVTDLLGSLRMTDALIGHLKGRPGAAVVNVSSGLASVPLPATPTYSATKAALHSYTASLPGAPRGQGGGHRDHSIGVQTELTPGQSEAAGYMPRGLRRRGHGAAGAAADVVRDLRGGGQAIPQRGGRGALRRRPGDAEHPRLSASN